jgi:hypothetical protein
MHSHSAFPKTKVNVSFKLKRFANGKEVEKKSNIVNSDQISKRGMDLDIIT